MRAKTREFRLGAGPYVSSITAVEGETTASQHKMFLRPILTECELEEAKKAESV